MVKKDKENNLRPLIFFSEYMKERFGHELYRVPISLPFLCPGRVNGTGSCIFCAEDAALARHLKIDMKLEEQVYKGVEYVRKRYGTDKGFIAYFQNFTPTNAPVDILREVYKKILQLEKFKMMIVATRPDCLPDDVISLLQDFNSRIETWVELGVQSANDKTLDLIRRGHKFLESENSIWRLHSAGINTAAHVILGLPGENQEDFRFTAKKLAALPLSAIKIHNLLILKNTELAKRFLADKNFVSPMDEYEYALNLLDFLRFIPCNLPLMRIVADAPPEKILAPKWKMTKAQFLEYFKTLANESEESVELLPKVFTQDGSFTIYNPEYKENYHSIAGALTEAKLKFIEPAKLRELLQYKKNVSILDIGFGLGYNAFAAIGLAENSNSHLEIISLEKDLDITKLCKKLFAKKAFELSILNAIEKTGCWTGAHSNLSLFLGDARKTICEIRRNFDIIFLDPFSTEKNPELWTYDFMRELAARLSPDGVILTYSSAFPVRGAMIRRGLYVGITPAFGRRRGGTIASFNKARIENPIPEKELKIITETTTGLAFRDFGFSWKREKILEFRKKLIKRLRNKGVPKWLCVS